MSCRNFVQLAGLNEDANTCRQLQLVFCTCNLHHAGTGLTKNTSKIHGRAVRKSCSSTWKRNLARTLAV